LIILDSLPYQPPLNMEHIFITLDITKKN
jgi:hypothetical protein